MILVVGFALCCLSFGLRLWVWVVDGLLVLLFILLRDAFVCELLLWLVL